MRDFVRQEELVALEGHGIVPPHQRRERQRLIQDREVGGAVSAGRIVFGQASVKLGYGASPIRLP